MDFAPSVAPALAGGVGWRALTPSRGHLRTGHQGDVLGEVTSVLSPKGRVGQRNGSSDVSGREQQVQGPRGKR